MGKREGEDRGREGEERRERWRGKRGRRSGRERRRQENRGADGENDYLLCGLTNDHT